MGYYLTGYLNWWLIGVLFLVGLYGVIVKENLLKKVMGLNVMQVAVILFFLNISQKTDTVLAVLGAGEKAGDVVAYVNPLPHALMLTAIVVALAVTGVALALLLKVYRDYGTLEEPELFRRMQQ
ncbi:MAG: cation:proton antiporter subunit C [Candidatus Desulforudis sp.]|nr:cation:proton antiporter subunit C [Desulforudis sp.]